MLQLKTQFQYQQILASRQNTHLGTVRHSDKVYKVTIICSAELNLVCYQVLYYFSPSAMRRKEVY